MCCLIINACSFSPGSYPNAEIYNINSSEDNLVELIEEYKQKHTEMKVPLKVGLKDGRRTKSDKWYHIYFYDKDENIIVKTWVRRINDNESILAFVGINIGTELGNWKFINEDFSYKENEMQIEKFEEILLEPILAKGNLTLK